MCFVLLVCTAYSQDLVIQPRIGKVYSFANGAVKLIPCDEVGESKGDSQVIPAKSMFVITKVLEDFYVISLLPYSTKNEKGYNVNFADAKDLNAKLYNNSLTNQSGSVLPNANIFFRLPKGDFVKYGGDRIPQSDFVFGLITLPIKMRFGSSEMVNGVQKRYFDFAGEISLGVSTGYRRRFSNIASYSILTGLAITSVPIDSFASKGLITSETNVSALTWHLGVLYQHKIFQIGIFTGLDFMKGELKRKWVYNNQPWLGIGLGIAILNTDPAGFSSKK